MVRTGSGNFHLYYSNDNEVRRVRPWANLPIDQLGAGYVVAPPSSGSKGSYEVVRGCLDDLDSLPRMRNAYRPRIQVDDNLIGGNRNKKLFGYLMEQSPHCDDLDALLDVARTFNDQAFLEPIDDTEIATVATSAWGYEQRGENYTKGGFAIIGVKTALALARDPYAGHLYTVLSSSNGPEARFWIADGLADTLEWPLRQLRKARKALIELGSIVQVTKQSPRKPAVYRWGPARLNPSRA